MEKEGKGMKIKKETKKSRSEGWRYIINNSPMNSDACLSIINYGVKYPMKLSHVNFQHKYFSVQASFPPECHYFLSTVQIICMASIWLLKYNALSKHVIAPQAEDFFRSAFTLRESSESCHVFTSQPRMRRWQESITSVATSVWLANASRCLHWNSSFRLI